MSLLENIIKKKVQGFLPALLSINLKILMYSAKTAYLLNSSIISTRSSVPMQ